MNPEVSAGGVVVGGDKVLVIRHARGEWIMPKGHLEPDEGPEEAALREVREETGLVAEILAPLGETRYVYRRKGETLLRPKRVLWYLMRPLSNPGELRLASGEGLLAAVWLSWEEARQKLTWAGDKDILQRAADLPAAGGESRR